MRTPIDPMFESVELLQSLVDGSDPLPRPYPQRLSFPNDRAAIVALAVTMGILRCANGFDLSRAEQRHLVFKLAAWCSRRGVIEPTLIRLEIGHVWSAVSLALRIAPDWLTSRAGVAWTLRRFKQFRAEFGDAVRTTFADPPRVGDVGRDGFYLVELSTAAHVHREGMAMGHCMAWSFNYDVLKKRRLQSGHDRLEALTYAVKLRKRELRIFSVRTRDGESVLTMSYRRKTKSIETVEGRWGWLEDKGFKRDAVLAVAKIVPVDDVPGW